MADNDGKFGVGGMVTIGKTHVFAVVIPRAVVIFDWEAPTHSDEEREEAMRHLGAVMSVMPHTPTVLTVMVPYPVRLDMGQPGPFRVGEIVALTHDAEFVTPKASIMGVSAGTAVEITSVPESHWPDRDYVGVRIAGVGADGARSVVHVSRLKRGGA